MYCTVECTFLLQISSNSNFIKTINNSNEYKLIGDVNLFRHDSDNRNIAEIEVMIALPNMKRNGFASKALCLIMKYGLEQLLIEKYFAKINENNEASIALFQKYSTVNLIINIFECLCLLQYISICYYIYTVLYIQYRLGFKRVNYVSAFQEYEYELQCYSPPLLLEDTTNNRECRYSVEMQNILNISREMETNDYPGGFDE